MTTVLHVIKGPLSDLARATIAEEVAAGDRIVIALLDGAPDPALPATVPIHRIPSELSYDGLLERVFEADQVIAW